MSTTTIPSQATARDSKSPHYFLFCADDICRLREDGATYTGDIAFTKTGNSCVSQLRRTDQSSRQRFMRHHYYRQPGYAKCRNPIASQAAPWCYTNNGQPELCDIPTCRKSVCLTITRLVCAWARDWMCRRVAVNSIT